jgi:hypothetical protein
MRGGHNGGDPEDDDICKVICKYVNDYSTRDLIAEDRIIVFLADLELDSEKFNNFMTKKIEGQENTESPFIKLFNCFDKSREIDNTLTNFIDTVLLKNNKMSYKVIVGNEEWLLEPTAGKIVNQITETTEQMNQKFDKIKNDILSNFRRKDYSLTPSVQNSTVSQVGGMNSNSNFSTLNNIINKLQQFSVLQDGGKSKSKSKKVSGSRKLHAHTEESSGGDSEKNLKNSKNIGSAMSLMMNSRRDQLFDQFKNTILGMLEKKIIQIKNKVIEATDDNASIIKSYLYRLVRDKNPTMSSFDKITILNKKSESEILEDLKDIPTIAELKKQMEEFKEAKQKEKEMNSDESGLTELPKQKTKKESKKSKGSKGSKSSKKSKN